MNRGVLVTLITLLMAGSSGFSAESRYIVRAPSTAVLPAWGIGLDMTGRVFMPAPETDMVKTPTTQTTDEMVTRAKKPNVGIALGIMGRGEVGVRVNSEATTAELKALVLEENGLVPAVVIGMVGIGSKEYPVVDTIAPAEYTGEAINNPENNSFYLVAGKKLPILGSLYAGIGTGQFRGHGKMTDKLHGLFGGWRMPALGPVWIAGELDGRSINAGIGASMSILPMLEITGAVKAQYLENIRSTSRDAGLAPGIGATLELVYTPFSCKSDDAKTEEAPVVEPAKAPPAIPSALQPAKASATASTAPEVKPVAKPATAPAPAPVAPKTGK